MGECTSTRRNTRRRFGTYVLEDRKDRKETSLTGVLRRRVVRDLPRHTRMRPPLSGHTPLCRCALAHVHKHDMHATACAGVRSVAGGHMPRVERMPGGFRPSPDGIVLRRLCTNAVVHCASVLVFEGWPDCRVRESEPNPQGPPRQDHSLIPEARRFSSRTGLSGLIGRPRFRPWRACMLLPRRTHAHNPVHVFEHTCKRLRAWSVEQARPGRTYACGLRRA